jgi:CheY-like chemotaxis protein
MAGAQSLLGWWFRIGSVLLSGRRSWYLPHHAHTRNGPLPEGEAGFAAILLESGWISDRDLAAARDYADREHLDLVEAVIALRFLDEHDSYAALSIAAGVEFVDLSEAELSVLAVCLVPASLAFDRSVVPIAVNNHVLTYATCRPFLKDTKRELTLATGRQARMVVAQRSAVFDALQYCYPTLDMIHSQSDVAGALGLDASSALRPSASVAKDGATDSSSHAAPRIESLERRHRVLVTDDDPVTRVVVKLLLQKQQFDVIEAVNGKHALDLAPQVSPDVALMDLNMPEMDGYEAIFQLRRDPSFAPMPIVVLTSEESPEIEHRVLQLGANDFLVKPFDPEVLVSRVWAAVRRAAAVPSSGVARGSWGS